MSQTCPNCGYHVDLTPAPPEPPRGTWVKDRYGGTHVRIVDITGRDGWAPAPSAFYAFGNWNAMWEARGPLEVCGPWGSEP